MVGRFNAKIVDIKSMTPTVKLFTLDMGKKFEFEPGQFVNLIFQKGEETLRKPYSISSNPTSSSEIELCIKLVEEGRGTPEIFKMKKGDEIQTMGPLGLFKLENTQKEKLVFIAAGTGVTPFRSMIKHLLIKNEEKELLLILGIRNENEILFQKEFEEFAVTHPQFKFVPVISQASEDWEGRQGHVQNNFDIIDPLNSEVYLCGLPPMIDAASIKLEEMGMLKENIHTEKYV